MIEEAMLRSLYHEGLITETECYRAIEYLLKEEKEKKLKENKNIKVNGKD